MFLVDRFILTSCLNEHTSFKKRISKTTAVAAPMQCDQRKRKSRYFETHTHLVIRFLTLAHTLFLYSHIIIPCFLSLHLVLCCFHLGVLLGFYVVLVLCLTSYPILYSFWLLLFTCRLYNKWFWFWLWIILYFVVIARLFFTFFSLTLSSLSCYLYLSPHRHLG